MDEKIKIRIQKARYDLLCQHPFYGALACNLQDCEFIRPTAATDGKHIFWNTKFIEGLNNKELLFVLFHEVMHCAHGHLWRFPINPRANIACDYVINRELKKLPLQLQMPKGCLLDSKYDPFIEEEIYHKIPESLVNQFSGGIGEFLEPVNMSKEDFEKLKSEWEEYVVAAAQTAKSVQGTIPERFDRSIGQATSIAKVNWKQETIEFIKQNVISSQNDWTRQSFRHSMSPVIFPRKKIRQGMVVVVRDTSGSISEDILGTFNNLIHGIQAELGCPIHLIDADADVAFETRIGPGDTFPALAKGGGGTDFRPAIKRAEEINQTDTVSGIVYLTDLYGSEPNSVDMPILWVSITQDKTARTGRTIYIKI